MDIFELFGTIAINNEQANKALSDTGKQAKGLSNTMEAAFSKMQGTARKIGAAIATAFAVDKIKDFGQSCAETFASVAAEESAFAQIMGDYAERATEKMQFVADKTGMVTSRLTPYMTSMTAKFKGLGYGVDEATNLAAEGLQIAADASAFWDKSLDESMSHLNSFINGSYEGGEAIGLFANDTQMAAYAVEKGIVSERKAWSELDEARKQATRLEYAKEMMKSSGATGQAALEASNFANVQANLTEQVRQFHSVIGEPIMNNIMLPAMRRLSQYMPKITEKTEAFLTKYTSGLKKFAGYFSKLFTEEGIDLSALPDALSLAMTNIWPKLNGLLMLKWGFALPHWKDIENKVSEWWPATKQSIESICTWVLQLPENPHESVEQIASTVKGWWATVGLPAVKSVSGWALNLFGHPVEDEATIAQHVTEWWKLAGNAVAGACSWTLQLFGVPEESAKEIESTIKTWWSKTVDSVQNVCAWALQLPDNPHESVEQIASTVSGWWTSTALPAIESASAWALQLFGHPVEDEATIAQHVTEWWKIAGGAVEGACVWTLQLFGMPKEGAAEVGASVKTWWDGVLPTVMETCTWTLKHLGILPWTEEDTAALRAWWDGVEATAISICNWMLNPPEMPDPDKMVESITNWWNGVKSRINLTFGVRPQIHADNVSSVVNSVGAPAQSFISNSDSFYNWGSIFNGLIDGSHAEGLDYVPRDNYIAQLHKGEAVLTSSQASMWRSGAMGGDVGRLEAAINNLGAMLQQVVNNTANGHQVVLDSGVLVGQIAPAMDMQLGTISGRKGRRN